MLPPFNLRNVLIAGSVAVIAAHGFVGATAWLLGAATGQQALAFIVGAAGGVAILWTFYAVALFCLWLRRKQVEGDRDA